MVAGKKGFCGRHSPEHRSEWPVSDVQQNRQGQKGMAPVVSQRSGIPSNTDGKEASRLWLRHLLRETSYRSNAGQRVFPIRQLRE